jgi:rhamnogalacturonyl hydrolase YesR
MKLNINNNNFTKTMKLVIIIASLFFIQVIFSANRDGLKSSNSKKTYPSNQDIEKKDVLKIMKTVADWQLANPSGTETWEWQYGAFYAGLMNLYKTYPEKRYLNAMVEMGNYNDWKLKPNPYVADNFAIAQTYLDLYKIVGDSNMIKMTQYFSDMQFYRIPDTPDVRWKNNPYAYDWWSWCDALFMAPPAFARMSEVSGDNKYINEMDRLWKITYDYLYDKDEHLFYRDDRFFDARTKSGKKVFWSRGNGWVVGGLVRVLEFMPKDFPDRNFYETVFKEMCMQLVQLQSQEGYWYSSLLDKNEFNIKETSGTGFFCYGFAWGINNNLLDKEKFLPAVEKAWETLTEAVEPSGKLDYVQQVGEGPDQIKKGDTETYGTGAFLLAGSEVYKLAK